MKWTLLSTLILGFMLSGCADLGSGDLNTSGICADMTASNDGNNKLTVTTRLTAGCGLGGSSVYLTGGDTLTALYQSQNYTLSGHTDIFNVTTYNVNTNLNYQAGQTVNVALNRGTGQVDAPGSYVYLPASFTVSAPAANSSYGLADTLSVNWSGTTAEDIRFSLNCSKDAGGTASITYYPAVTTVPYSVSMSYLDSNVVNTPGRDSHISSCTGSVSVIRSSNGSADPALDSGSRIRGQYVVSRNISLSF